MASFIDLVCFAWSDDLKLEGIWEHPGGDKKAFKFSNSKGILQIEGKEVGKVYQDLCAKILNSLHSTVENTNQSDMSCQTNTDTLRLPSCTCADVVSDIQELKLSQEINRNNTSLITIC